jgi:hypothetical protein
MVAVRNLLSSLNSLAHSGLLAGGWPRPAEDEALPTTADAEGSAEPEPYAEGGVEPPLDELLDDPVIHLVMRADRLEPEEVRRILNVGKGQPAP